MMLKSYKSVFPTAIIGKADDNGSKSYLSSINNKEENVEIVLTKDYGKYYYKYKLGNSTYPTSYIGNGLEFIPNGDNINFKITSSVRSGNDDKGGVKIKIVNKTDKVVKVKVTDDDKKDSRVHIDNEGGSVDIEK